MKDTFWVGVYPGMSDEMIDYMAKTIRTAVERQGRGIGKADKKDRGSIAVVNNR